MFIPILTTLNHFHSCRILKKEVGGGGVGDLHFIFIVSYLQLFLFSNAYNFLVSTNICNTLSKACREKRSNIKKKKKE